MHGFDIAVGSLLEGWDNETRERFLEPEHRTFGFVFFVASSSQASICSCN